MKDLMIQWEEDHKFEHPDGTWSRADSNGEPVGERYATEEELNEALWDYMARNPECYLPMRNL